MVKKVVKAETEWDPSLSFSLQVECAQKDFAVVGMR